MAKLDAARIRDLFAQLGERLGRPATLCLIGSTPGIASGQPARQTADIDVWHDASDYDAGDLAQACEAVGLLFDPRGELDPDKSYLQIVRPGIVRLPDELRLETIDRFGKLTAMMPAPGALVAAKLVRGSDTDLEDVVWWVRQRRLDVEEIERYIAELPDPRDRETAVDNLSLVQLLRSDRT
jgi:hypothetical protein